jgi:hypothetical protein
MKTRVALACVAVIVGTLTSGCANSRLVNAWANPKYEGHPYRKIILLGVSGRPDIRRTYEDRFVEQLKARGVDAVPGYEFIPNDRKASQEEVKRAVEQSGAEALLITRLAKVEKRTEIEPAYGPMYYPYGYYGFYSWAWAGYYEPARIYQYDVVTLEIRLVDAKTGELVWAGATRTEDPQNVQKEFSQLAKIVVDELAARTLI